jgi:hypothetical protein
MVINRWTLLFHEAIVGRLKSLADACRRARQSDLKNFRLNANVKIFAALAKLMLEVIPADWSRPQYRQGNTLGAEYRHWFRPRFFGAVGARARTCRRCSAPMPRLPTKKLQIGSSTARPDRSFTGRCRSPSCRRKARPQSG